MLILGSQSPRRKEILSYFRVPFQQISPNFDESLIPTSLPPPEYVTTLAKKKAEAISLSESDIVITADTVVILGTKILGKPSSIEHAVEMLLALSHTTHEVVTGVCVRTQSKILTSFQTTKVTFLPLTKENALAYATHFNVLDKAGGYAIQDGGAIIVEKIEGCFYNVMGLPLRITVDMLSKVGVHIWDILGNA